MADLVVTFTKARTQTATDAPNFPVAEGRSARTQAIAIGASSVTGVMQCQDGEDFAVIRAGAACWVAIGEDPTAAAVDGSGSPADIGDSWYMDTGDRLEFSIQTGDQVAVIQA